MDRGDSARAEHGLRPLFEPAALALVQLALLAGFRGGLDLNAFDEGYHLAQGKLLARGDWGQIDPAFSLPLTALYALLELAGVPAWQRADLVAVGSTLAATLALGWALRRLLAPGAALAATLWWAGSSVALHGSGQAVSSSYVLGLALAALAVGLVARGRALAALAVLGVAVLNRAEIALWIALAGLLWLVPGRAGARPGWRLGGAYAGTGAALLVLLQLAWQARARAWLAFSQHFRWGHPAAAEAAPVFPGASSVAEALRADPGEFAAHVGRNALALPRALGTLLFDAWSWIPWLQPLLSWALVALAALGVASRAVRRAPALDPGAARFLLASLAVLGVNLILLPRPALLVPLVPALLWLSFGAAHAGWRVLAAGRAPSRLHGRALLCAALGALLVLGGPFRGGPLRGGVVRAEGGPRDEARTPNRVAVELLRAHLAPGDTLLAAQADVLLVHAGLEEEHGFSPTGLGFRAAHGALALDEIVARFRPAFLLDTPFLRASPARRAELEALLASGAWRLRAARAPVALYARAP